MTLLLPTSGIVAFHTLREAADRLRRLLVTHLTRTPSGARHRLLTPGQIRWRRWKSALADCVAGGLADLTADSVPQPRTPVRPHRETSRAPARGALDPPARTAQSHDPHLSDDDRWTDEQAPVTDYALPNGGSHFLSAAEPEVWPEASTEAWTEPWSEPSAQSWSEPRVEPQAEHADNYMSGCTDEPVYANPLTGRRAVGGSAFAHHTAGLPGELDGAARHEVRDRLW